MLSIILSERLPTSHGHTHMCTNASACRLGRRRLSVCLSARPSVCALCPASFYIPTCPSVPLCSVGATRAFSFFFFKFLPPPPSTKRRAQSSAVRIYAESRRPSTLCSRGHLTQQLWHCCHPVRVRETGKRGKKVFTKALSSSHLCW